MSSRIYGNLHWFEVIFHSRNEVFPIGKNHCCAIILLAATSNERCVDETIHSWVSVKRVQTAFSQTIFEYQNFILFRLDTFGS